MDRRTFLQPVSSALSALEGLLHASPPTSPKHSFLLPALACQVSRPSPTDATQGYNVESKSSSAQRKDQQQGCSRVHCLQGQHTEERHQQPVLLQYAGKYGSSLREAKTRVHPSVFQLDGREREEYLTASRNPRSIILFVVVSTLPVRRRSYRILSLCENRGRQSHVALIQNIFCDIYTSGCWETCSLRCQATIHSSPSALSSDISR